MSVLKLLSVRRCQQTESRAGNNEALSSVRCREDTGTQEQLNSEFSPWKFPNEPGDALALSNAFCKVLGALGDRRKRRWGKECDSVFLQGK